MPSKPLIVHIITRLEPGGSSRNVVDSCAAQVSEYGVVLISGPHRDSAPLRKLLPPEVNYIEIESLRREISAARDLKAFRELKKQLVRLQPAIVHTHTSKAGALGRLAAAAANLRAQRPSVIVHTPHGHLFYGYYGPLKTFVFRLAEKFLAGFADRLVALTPGEMRESIAAGIGKPGQWAVVHSGVDLRPPAVPLQKRDLDIPADEIAIGTVARLEPVKGVEVLVRAAALLVKRLPGKKLRFVIVGAGELEAQLRALAAGLGVRDRVLFTGFRGDAAAAMGALDIYVQPSLNEGMGRAPLEAQALGLPVVVSRVCGLPDVIREGETGLSVEPRSPEDLAAALEKLILSPGLRARMGAAARVWALEKDSSGFPRFGPESMNIRLKALYTGILGTQPGGGRV